MGYLWRDRVRLSWPLALVGVTTAVIVARTMPGTSLATTMIQLAAAYAMFVAAFRVPQFLKRVSAKMPDYSYGIYIYAFPAQQLAIAMGWSSDPLSNVAVGFLLTLPCAAISWHLVEQPALTIKTRA